MRSFTLSVTFALFIIPTAARAQTDMATLEKLRKELIEVEVTTEQFRRLIPVEFDLAAERQAIDQLARKAELSPIEVKVVPGTERLPLVIHRLELSGRDPFDAVHFFVSMLRIRARLVGIESARFDAGPDATVHYVIRLAYPSWSDVPDETVERSDVVSMMRRKVERERAAHDDIVAAVAQLQEDPLEALAVFTKAAEEHPIALTSVRIDGAISMEGLVLGAAARAALATSVETAKLSVSRTSWSRAGACEAFSITARTDDPRIAEFTPAGSLFDADSVAFCTGDPQPATRHVAVPGASTTHFLRLRNFDVHDLFFVLSDLLAENFVVDENVKGRVTLDVPDTASVEELLGAIGSGTLFIGPGPLRRVSSSEPPVSPADRRSSAGEPISVSLRHVHLSSVLCLLAEVSGQTIRMPVKSQRRLSLFATELPVGVLLTRLVPSSSSDAVNACEVPTGSSPRVSRRPRQFEQLGIGDLRIAGLAHVGDAWKAYVYPPAGPAMAVEIGQRLFDGEVKSIGPNSVTFAMDGKGVIEVPLLP